MNVLMISRDRRIFEEKSDARSRIVEYGTLFHELHVIVFSRNKPERAKEHLADNVIVYPTNSLSRFLYSTDAAIIADGILKDLPPRAKDEWVVSAQDPFDAGLAGLKIKKRHKIALQVQVHGDDIGNPWFRSESLLNRLRLRIADKVLPKADCIRVVSKRIKRTLAHTYTLACEPYVLPIWRDVSAIQKRKITYDLHAEYPQFDFIALASSRLEKVKNIALAIETFKDVVKHDAKAGLIIVGEGSDRRRLESLALKLNLKKNVIFEGWQDDVISRYKTADIFLNTSNHEGYCLALIEAAAAGCPIITTDVGIVGEELNESNVFVCPVGDKDCFNKKIISAIHNKPVLAKIAEKARAGIAERAISKTEYLDRYRESVTMCAA